MRQVNWILDDENKKFVEDYQKAHGLPNQHAAINAILSAAPKALALLTRVRDESEHATDMGDNYIEVWDIDEEIYMEINEFLRGCE